MGQRRFSFELDSGEFFSPRVSSPYAALIDTVESSGGSLNTLKILDLRTGHLADHDVGNGTELQLTKHGVAVVISAGQLERVDRNGKVTTLDSGQLGSLALSGDGRLVYWLKGG